MPALPIREQFFDSLRQQGVELVQTLPFGDHHRYSARELTAIGRRCRELGVDTAITTEKDAENLPPASLHPQALRVLIARVLSSSWGEGLQELLMQTLARISHRGRDHGAGIFPSARARERRA